MKTLLILLAAIAIVLIVISIVHPVGKKIALYAITDVARVLLKVLKDQDIVVESIFDRN